MVFYRRSVDSGSKFTCIRGTNSCDLRRGERCARVLRENERHEKGNFSPGSSRTCRKCRFDRCSAVGLKTVEYEDEPRMICAAEQRPSTSREDVFPIRNGPQPHSAESLLERFGHAYRSNYRSFRLSHDFRPIFSCSEAVKRRIAHETSVRVGSIPLRRVVGEKVGFS